MLIYSFSLYFSRQTPDDLENSKGRKIKYVGGFSCHNWKFSEHFCWPMELVLALGISGFILINPLNFKSFVHK